ncbi:branched-chain amino acid aminotransferase [Streptomyces sp. NPDC029674]|uniref:branched-chain amino acid aminotransferase n=1 Tax=Streptomyces sp. NPDC029674 TaxID=3365297 RepID=UPI00384B88AE
MSHNGALLPDAPLDDRDGLIWFDGELVPWREARLHVLSHGLHYASSVFEGERAYAGRVFRLHDHSERLIASARELGFELPYSAADLDAATREVVRRSGITDGYVRPVAWRGSHNLRLASGDIPVHVAIAAWPWPDVFAPGARLHGIRLGTSRWRRPSPHTAPVRAKAASLYAVSTLAAHEAEAAGFDDALLLDHRGLLAEATGANLFLVLGRELHTPVPDCFLDGITRRTVIESARDLGITVVERHIEPGELAGATEVFLTGTAYEVQPVASVDGLEFTVGEVTTALVKAFGQAVARDAEIHDAAAAGTAG